MVIAGALCRLGCAAATTAKKKGIDRRKIFIKMLVSNVPHVDNTFIDSIQ
jgi:hypothetical protein